MKVPERGPSGHFWSGFLDLRELCGSNQKTLVHNLEERKKNRGSWFLKFVDRSNS